VLWNLGPPTPTHRLGKKLPSLCAFHKVSPPERVSQFSQCPRFSLSCIQSFRVGGLLFFVLPTSSTQQDDWYGVCVCVSVCSLPCPFPIVGGGVTPSAFCMGLLNHVRCLLSVSRQGSSLAFHDDQVVVCVPLCSLLLSLPPSLPCSRVPPGLLCFVPRFLSHPALFFSLAGCIACACVGLWCVFSSSLSLFCRTS
jgi:hypothetical protein